MSGDAPPPHHSDECGVYDHPHKKNVGGRVPPSPQLVTPIGTSDLHFI